jgi:Lrp/AsnC family leucine-responsive transcriptional regulator
MDEIDVRLLRELQADADRPNVELARVVGLSPAATLHRVRRLKDSGLIRGIRARLNSKEAGFPLAVYVMASLGSHDDRTHKKFETLVKQLPQVLEADWVTGETDVLLQVVARDVDELQKVLFALSSKGGASRVTTLLRMQELKPSSPLPVTPAASSSARRR